MSDIPGRTNANIDSDIKEAIQYLETHCTKGVDKNYARFKEALHNYKERKK